MNSEHIIQALNDIDPELVADAEEKCKKPAKRRILKWGAAAACFCLILAMVCTHNTSTPEPNLPKYDSAQYTASEIADLFGDTYGVPTSSYTKVYVPSRRYLDIQPIPDSEYLTIYQFNVPDESLDKAEFADFLDLRLPRLAHQLNITLPPYAIEEKSYSDGYSVYLDEIEDYFIYNLHNAAYNAIHFSPSSGGDRKQEIRLSGTRIQVNQTHSDTQIAASLWKVKKKLFSIFNVEFSDIKIVRYYDAYSDHGVISIDVFFYNEDDHPLNAILVRPVSDHISLDFYNKGEGTASDTVLRDVSVDYTQCRFDVKEVFTAVKQLRKISLEEAEALLYKGYVFGGHTCPICMSQQSKVDFSDYDLVGIKYIRGDNIRNGTSEIIPFYAFYKKIGTAKNGNEIYAQTYVPAIEVSGYEEYFENQKEEHNDPWFENQG